MQWIDFSRSANQRAQSTVFDEEQKKTKNLAVKGAALIRGVAGSGKSLVLLDRLEQIRNQGFEHILVLSYNRYMNARLKQGFYETPNPSKSRVECKTFHSWAYQPFGYSYKDDRDEEARKKLIEDAKESKLNYQAILVDEAQDFYDEWFQALTEVLDPETNSLFFVYDNTQSIYGQSHRRKNSWSWKSLGIEVPGGRSQIFDVNYRNSPEILEFAWKFICPSVETAEMGIAKKASNPSIDKIIEPKKKSARSSGIAPLLVQGNRSSMPAQIAQQVKLAKQDHPAVRIGILLHPKTMSSNHLMQGEIAYHLSLVGIDSIAPTNSQARDNNLLRSGSVVIDSWNAVKGMEFDAVIIAGLDYVFSSHEPDEDFEEKSRLYVAMTRAKDHLVMLYEQETEIVHQLQQALNSADCLEAD